MYLKHEMKYRFGKRGRLDLIIWTIGFSGISAQIVLMRECLTVFYGNEIAIGSLLCAWLIWTGLGSLLASRQKHPKILTILFLQIGLAAAMPLTFLGIRAGRSIFGVSAGEIIGLGPMFFLIMILLAPFCLLSGAAYPTVCHGLAAEKLTLHPSGRPFILEAFGAGVGGIAASLFFLPRLDAGEILLALLAMNLLSGAVLCFRRGRHVRSWLPSSVLVILSAAALLPVSGENLERLGDRVFWRNRRPFLSENTAYGHMTFSRQNGQITLYQNGLHVWSAPDPETSEEAVHLSLIQHPDPRRVLLLGAGPEGALQEALKHASIESAFYVDPDRKLLDLTRMHLPPNLSLPLDDPRIRFRSEDGRGFLARNDTLFDAVLLNMPSPYTAQINRYYTQEFFRLVHQNLSEDGIFGIALQGSENVIGHELADFLSAIHGTLTSVFPYTIVLPGETVRMVASVSDRHLSTHSDTLVKRIRNLRLGTWFVEEYYLFDRLAPDRIDYIKERLYPISDREINRDFFPIGYYYDAILWATYFSGATKSLYQALRPLRTSHILIGLGLFGLLGMLSLKAFRGIWRKRCPALVSLSIWSVGFTEISLEFALILGFQIICGHIYPHVALMVSAYMIGLSMGAWRQTRCTDASIGLKSFTILQAAMALLPLMVMAFLGVNHLNGGILNSDYIALGFSSLIALCGFIGGKQFVLATQLAAMWSGSSGFAAGILYGIDLIGSSGGALIASALLIPLFGLMDTLLILAVLNAVVLLLLIVDRNCR